MFRMRQGDCNFIFTLLPITTQRNLVFILSQLHRKVKEQIVTYGGISEMSDIECQSAFGFLPLYRKRQLIWMVSEIASLIHRIRTELHPFEDLQMNDKRRLLSSIVCFRNLFKSKQLLRINSESLSENPNEAWDSLKPGVKRTIKRIQGDVFREIMADKDWYVVLLVTRSRYIKKNSENY